MSERRVPWMILVVALAATLVPRPGAAASASFWRTDTFAAFLEGDAEGVSIRQDGSLVLSPEFQGKSVPGARYAWGAAPGSGDRRYVRRGSSTGSRTASSPFSSRMSWPISPRSPSGRKATSSSGRPPAGSSIA